MDSGCNCDDDGERKEKRRREGFYTLCDQLISSGHQHRNGLYDETTNMEC
jgi:hypothetical protein